MLSLLALFAAQVAAAPLKSWPTSEQDIVLKDFRFGSGETFPELRMHVTTLGTPRRDRAGRIDNAVMVLHGTGGSGTGTRVSAEAIAVASVTPAEGPSFGMAPAGTWTCTP